MQARVAGPGTLSPTSGKRVSASCLDYVEHHGDARVPQSYAVDGFRLGDWVSTQRIQHSKGTLHADRQQRLETVNGWTWDPFADQWEEGFSRLLDYVEHHDHARIPRSYTVGGYRLGAWIDRQRSSHSNGTLDGDRKQRLEDLNGWTWDPVADRWEEGFSRLLAYAESNGHARVPFSYIVDDYQLGAWVNSQRSVYSKGTLDADRQRRLQALPGWTWRPSADRWEEGYNRLLDYVKRRGDARVPISYAIDGFKLGTWVSTQRTNYTEGTLEADHRRLLEVCRAGHGDLRPTNGRRVTNDCWTTSNDTGTRVLRSPASSTVSNSAHGSAHNVPITPNALSTPIANGDFRA